VRGLLHRLWWSMGWLQVRYDRFVIWASYKSLVLKTAWEPTGRFLGSLRAELALLVVVAFVALLQRPERTLRDAVGAIFWGLLAAAILIGLVFIWNLVRAPYRVFRAMKSELMDANSKLEEELQAYRWPKQQAAELRKTKLRNAALPLRTELRDIRHKIEMVKSTRPNPHYSHGFRLPGARWDQYDAFLAEDWPDLYPVIERAYTLAHHVNEALRIRETRAGAGKTIGVIPDDGLDEAHEAAGVALDALGESRGEPWQTKAQAAVNRVVDDIQREWEEKEAADQQERRSGNE
jgi:hypothetical protein